MAMKALKQLGIARFLGCVTPRKEESSGALEPESPRVSSGIFGFGRKRVATSEPSPIKSEARWVYLFLPNCTFSVLACLTSVMSAASCLGMQLLQEAAPW